MEKKANGGGSLGIYRYSASPSSHHFPSHYPNLKYPTNISPVSTRIISPYPNAYQIEETYASRHNPSFFNTHLADNVDGSVAGQDFHLGGRFDSIQAHNDRVLSRIGAALKTETWRAEAVRVIRGGESAWAAIKTLSTATFQYGRCRA